MLKFSRLVVGVHFLCMGASVLKFEKFPILWALWWKCILEEKYFSRKIGKGITLIRLESLVQCLKVHFWSTNLKELVPNSENP